MSRSLPGPSTRSVSPNRITQLRLAHDLTITSLADALGYGRAYTGNICSGLRQPSRLFKRRAVEFFGVSEAWLFPDGAR